MAANPGGQIGWAWRRRATWAPVRSASVSDGFKRRIAAKASSTSAASDQPQRGFVVGM